MKNSSFPKALLFVSVVMLLISCEKSNTAIRDVNLGMSADEDVSSLTSIDTGTLNDKLIAYYPFTGNAKDRSGNKNNGKIHQANLTTDRFGNPNSAYSFNGFSSYILIPDDSLFDLTGDFSISSWFKMDQYASTYNASMLISKHDGDIGSDGFIYGILNADHNNNQFLIFGANGIWGMNPNPVTYVQTSNWYNYIVTFNKITGSLSYYLNGVLVSSQNGPIDMLPNNLNVTIGYSKSSYGTYLDYFTGTIDDVRIYTRVLSSREVKYLYKH